MCHGLAHVPEGTQKALVDILPLRRIVGRINATPRGDPTARDILGGAGAFESDCGSIEVRRFVSRVPSRVARPTKSLRSTNEGPRHPRPRFVAHDG